MALDETVIQINDEQLWLYVAVNSEPNHVLHIRLYSRRTTAFTDLFIGDLREKHDVDDGEFLVDGVPWLQTALSHPALRFRHETHGNRNAVERVYREIKRQTYSFSNTFNHIDPTTAESWLLVHTRWHNSLN